MPSTKWVIAATGGQHDWFPCRVRTVNNFFSDPGHPLTSPVEGYFGPTDLDTMVDIVYRTRTWKITIDYNVGTDPPNPSGYNGVYSMGAWEHQRRGSTELPSIPNELFINGVDLDSGRAPLTQFLTGSNFTFDLFQFPVSPGPFQQFGPIIYRASDGDGLGRLPGYYVKGDFSMSTPPGGDLFTQYAPNDSTIYKASEATILLKTKSGATLHAPLGGFKIFGDWLGSCTIEQETLWPY